MPMAFVTTWTIAWVRSTLAASAMVQARFTSADVRTSHKATATVTETKKTPWACVEVTAPRTKTPMASVTMWTTAWVRLTRAASAMAQERFTSADAMTSHKATATVTATKRTPWACVEVIAQRTPMPMASVTTWTTAWVNWTPAAYAMAQERSSNVDARTSQRETAIATATKKTPWAYAVVTAQKTPMRMASVTTWTTALDRLTFAAFATVLARSTIADVRTSLTRRLRL